MSALPIPNNLNLSPSLAAHKYILVCTLTVVTWDSFVLAPRSRRMWKTQPWSTLKLLYHFLQVWMPVELSIVAAGFLNSTWSVKTCEKFYLFEPISTAVLLAGTSGIHVMRVMAIHNRKRHVVAPVLVLFLAQLVTTAVMCGFYMSVPLLPGQGCIAGPKHIWVGIYWITPTLLYATTFGLAIVRSIKTLATQPVSLWSLILHDGLNLYGGIVIIHLINVLFWFIVSPTGSNDSIRTSVSSITAALTVCMTMRIVLSVHGTLLDGGVYRTPQATNHAGASHPGTISGGSAHNGSRSRSAGDIQPNLSNNKSTYTIDQLSMDTGKPTGEWPETTNDAKSSVHEDPLFEGKTDTGALPHFANGVRVTVDRQLGYDHGVMHVTA